MEFHDATAGPAIGVRTRTLLAKQLRPNKEAFAHADEGGVSDGSFRQATRS
jgi:hypothetical protein